jgi:sister-chromatid-cohesion protein PDS5
MSVFLWRASLCILNQSSIPILVKRIQKGHGSATSQTQLTANHAQILLKFVSKHSPAIYKPHVGELAKAIADEKNTRLVEVCLQALAAVVRWDDKLAPSDKSVKRFSRPILFLMLPRDDRRTTERVMHYVLDSNPRHGKFAARLLAFCKNREETCAQVVEVGRPPSWCLSTPLLIPAPLVHRRWPCQCFSRDAGCPHRRISSICEICAQCIRT